MTSTTSITALAGICPFIILGLIAVNIVVCGWWIRKEGWIGIIACIPPFICCGFGTLQALVLLGVIA